MEKQGIVTILCSDCEKSKAAPLRITLSADMSSKKWLAKNGFFFSIEKISSPSDQELGNQSDGEEECRIEKDDLRVGKPSALDVWGSILSKKSEDSAKIPEPYIHPLVKRSASSLSEKSLEICTESLGSETGSGCFSSYPASEISDADEEKEDQEYEQKQQQQQQVKESNSFEDFHVVKYKNSPPRPFPPPIPSIADGNSIQIQSHRRNGRLILEAVSVPPRNNFHVQRHNGRLVLTLIKTPISPEQHSGMVEENNVQEFDEVFDDMEEIDQDVEEKINDGGYEEADEERVKQISVAKGLEFVIYQNSRSLPIGGTMKKLMRLANKNPKWSNKIVNLKEVEELPIPQSLPPRPARVPRLIPPPPPLATSFNSYQYFWRSKTNPQSSLFKNNSYQANGAKTYHQQNMVLVKGNTNDEYFLPLSWSCKKPGRSMLIWEHNCVATS
ncbi:protein FAF-like, chloroplastic [Olea europaea var. sylvestris]|uniref:protein FAF-like, chloroplastic n=1 Tax=Olea europaea var. sylvestris TaxID=158386 RepID=UPI000C1D5715|nr:protein FAF-like, chloroplastic [Olea europaea var. sylvestris]